MKSASFSCLLIVLYSLSTHALPGGRRPWLQGSPIFAVDPPVLHPSPPVHPDPHTYPKPGPMLAVDPPVYQHQRRRPGVVEASHGPQPEQQCGIFGCNPGDITKRITLTKINNSLDDLSGGGLFTRRLCRIGLANLNDKVLNNPRFSLQRGVQTTMPAYELPVERTILLLFESNTCITGMICYGTEGVLTYDIVGTTQKVALMWLQPWDLDKDIKYNYKIIPNSIPTNSDLFNEMKRDMMNADGVVRTEKDQGVWMETVMYKDRKSKLILRMDSSPPTTTTSTTTTTTTAPPSTITTSPATTTTGAV